MKKIDARGMSCPQPVLMVQKAVKQDNPSQIEVLVDNPVAVENITRLATSMGYGVTVAHQGEISSLVLERGYE